MEEIVSLIFHGGKLVKELEESLPNIANQPHVLISSCDEISRVFGNARERLTLAVQDYGTHHESLPQMEVGGGSVPEWLRSSHAMDMGLHEQLAHHQHHGFDAIAGQELGGGNVEAVATDVAQSSLHRPRRRKHEADRRTFRVPAPRMGNTEVPPEDGYTWRKYGQKEILGSKFPRGYFRCTHQKLYNCPAKKQVQRLDNDPYTFEVTYRGEHTCIMSSTAPSMPPPPSLPEAMTSYPTSHNIPLTTSQPVTQWLSIDVKQPFGELYSTIAHHNMQMYKSQSDNIGGGGTGPSSPARYTDYPGVTDLIDTMFNSGSSSNNSMELIFSSEEKKDDREKTN
ncbi:WRKY transcription factor 55-like [Cynara cardunculus var. scolymus]|uniref:DNA-binding WRKY n=1 Tax=Cynara cardunculus var. scolymus TaxID=59895 RepID=A0A118K626_CYNCS|nr:WRKY transcription factor 55-like [Cynara cardunculus var. scolymus]KVI09991.1 DNA-binding WRKY [Cynara cardunculus var. scolymus]